MGRHEIYNGPILDMLQTAYCIGTQSQARGVNRHGVIVGNATAADGSYRAVRWNTDGRITKLAVPAGSYGGSAYALNNKGVIVGLSGSGSGVDGALRWTRPTP